MNRLQIAVALYPHILRNTHDDVCEAFDLAERFIEEEKARQDKDLHLEIEANEAPNDDGVPF